ncbi:hypothetical protein HY993_03350 [Candidatus Micrarchaeota archaeon]|nr:hypothetical protein [Candidatus Micrarchaeota archaeon]
MFPEESLLPVLIGEIDSSNFYNAYKECSNGYCSCDALDAALSSLQFKFEEGFSYAKARKEAYVRLNPSGLYSFGTIVYYNSNACELSSPFDSLSLKPISFVSLTASVSDGFGEITVEAKEIGADDASLRQQLNGGKKLSGIFEGLIERE